MLDSRRVVYKVSKATQMSIFFERAVNFSKNSKNLKLAGYGNLAGDILIYWYNYSKRHMSREYWIWSLEDLAMHEFGHLFGLWHNNDPQSIMCLSRRRGYPNITKISEHDIRNFCKLYNCH